MSKQSNNRKKQNNCIQFAGQEIPKRDLQKLLKKMEPDERVYSLSQLRTSQILEKLMSHAMECQEKVEELGPMEMLVEPTKEEQETYLNNKALFDEWNELLDEDGKDTGSNYLGDGVVTGESGDIEFVGDTIHSNQSILSSYRRHPAQFGMRDAEPGERHQI